jgi:hypothetical protein
MSKADNYRKGWISTGDGETTSARNEMAKPKRSLRFKLGVFFLVVNVPFV